MDDPRRHERRQHFRGKPRPGRQIPVRYRRADVTEWTPAETKNVGVGGAFIATAPLPVGAPVVVELFVPTSDRKFELTALVRWTTEGSDGHPAGMGVQFVDVDIDVLLDLNDYFATLTGKEA
jgi:uncharacterized protein (TIGR02266 family)